MAKIFHPYRIVRVPCNKNASNFTKTHLAEIVPGESPLAELVAQPVQVCTVQLDHLAVEKAEPVRCRGYLSAALFEMPF